MRSSIAEATVVSNKWDMLELIETAKNGDLIRCSKQVLCDLGKNAAYLANKTLKFELYELDVKEEVIRPFTPGSRPGGNITW